ncbi:MAG: 2-amino-4-hydroxy-6-hydroxymethyldihydropteridine diphosphokinase [Phormidium sp. GEM2.Bin31]|nr:MAG: 2-amino-4-hydroxy-6-hydroxymethyldihydropteridine diphosphokinase [Phormidium sp. GEM2.Bin31]
MDPVAIALGSNLGDSRGMLEGAVNELRSLLGGLQQSHWYRTKPVGPPQPDYLNGCVIGTTSLEPLELLQRLLEIEAAFGRVRGERWGARTLDLDLLLYGDRILDHPQLQVPHPRLAERAFVLVPLAEIAPHWRDPRSGNSIKQLQEALNCSDVHLIS